MTAIFENFTNRNDQGYASCSPESVFEEFAHLEPDDYESDESETQFKSIPMKEYNILMNLDVQVYKLQNSINGMAKAIKSKDAELKILRGAQNKCVNVSQLSAVSVSHV